MEPFFIEEKGNDFLRPKKIVLEPLPSTEGLSFIVVDINTRKITVMSYGDIHDNYQYSGRA